MNIFFFKAQLLQDVASVSSVRAVACANLSLQSILSFEIILANPFAELAVSVLA